MWRSQQSKGGNQAGNDDGDLIDAEAAISESFSDEFAEGEVGT